MLKKKLFKDEDSTNFGEERLYPNDCIFGYLLQEHISGYLLCLVTEPFVELFYTNTSSVNPCFTLFNALCFKGEIKSFITKDENLSYSTKPEGNQAKLLFKGEKRDSKGYTKRTYRSSETDCKNCPLREQCCGKSTKFKKLDDSIHKEHYDRMHQKLTQNEKYAKKMVKVRSKTVEPVIGTLVNFTNMKRVNTRGIKNANKHVLMASLTYNLKKYMRFTIKKPSILAQVISLKQGKCFAFSKRAFSVYKNSILSYSNSRILNYN